MAGNTINFELKLNSNIKQETQDAREFHKTISAAAAAAQNIEYGRARGAMGGTGASARDFANQAQGLGGLVRVYATVAANAFAAASAFNALKQAADTTTLQEGLNQLGAASGMALGNLAKSFVTATDGAISFRDAATAAAKATSAGLSSRQFLQIGESAKRASQALGIDMNDAVNRLTRGITKLEPELLDELGIYTKIGPAVEEYARKLGKAETGLTDFERRQAFAIAVLEEANKKFGEINIPSNPYQKLEANLKNLTQAGLEFINKFLQPIASVFANSTTLLGLALGGIIIKLSKMAIPALTSWQDELRKSADSAKAYAAKINESFGAGIVRKVQEGLKVPDIEAGLARAKEAYANTQASLINIDKQTGEKRRAQAYKGFDIPKLAEDPKKLKNALRGIQTEIRQLTELGSDPTATPQTTKLAQARVLLLQQQKKELIEVVRYTKDLRTANEQVEDIIEKKKTGIGETLRSKISKREGARAERLGIVADIGNKVELEGFTAAVGDMYKKVNDSKQMGGFTKLRTLITGTFTAGVAQISMFLRAFGGWAQAAAVGIAAFTVFDDVFSKNKKQLEAFNKEIENNENTVENASRVLKKYGTELFTTESISAGATAIGELTDGVDALSEKLANTISAQGTWDRFKDGILSFIGESSQQDFASAVANNWAKQLQLLPEGEIKSAATAKLKSILNVSELSASSMKKAVETNKIPAAVVKEGQKALEPAIIQQRQFGNQVNQTRESITQLNKASLDLQNTFLDQSPLAKFAEALIKASIDINKSFENINTGIAAMQDIINKPAAFAMIDQKFIGQLREVIDLRKQDAQSNAIVAQNQQEINTLRQESERLGPRTRMGGAAGQAARARVENINQDIRERNRAISNIESKREQALNDKIAGAILAGREAFKQNILEGFRILSKTEEFAQRQSALGIQRNIMSGISGTTPGIAQAQYNLNIKDIELQREQLQVTTSLINQLTLNTIAQSEANAILSASKLEEKQQKGTPLTDQETKLLEGFNRDQTELADLRKKVSSGTTLDADYMTRLGGAAGSIALNFARQKQGERAQFTQLNAKTVVEGYNLEIGKLREVQALIEYREKIDLEATDNVEKRFNLINSGITILSAEQLQLQQNATLEKQRLASQYEQAKLMRQNEEDSLKLKQLLKENKDVENDQTKAIRNRIEFRSQEANDVLRQRNTEFEILKIQQEQARILRLYNEQTRIRAFNSEMRQKSEQIDQNNLDTQIQLLEIQNQRGQFTPDEYAQRKKRLDLLVVEKNFQTQLAQIQDNRLQAEAELNKEIATVAAANADPEIGGLQGVTFRQSIAWLEERNRIIDKSNLDTQAARQAVDNRKKIIEAQTELNDRQLAYETIFKNSFDSLADAMVNWMQTGKWAGKELFNSLIADLTRYELKLQMVEVYKAAKPGILNFAAALTGGDGFGSGREYGNQDLGLNFAKGGYFNKGIMAFAKGGMFTNSIVNEPTLFKFAKGTGLMGEAGPEAIMPLKRDSQGNLGVSGGGQKTEVVINNYSNQPATTQETTDSRGNRKIEVVIGEMTAGEFQRSGSTSQRAMRSTFGLAPQLIRR